MLLGDERVRKI